MVQTLEDLFARANDNTGLGTAWRVEAGNLQVLDEAAQQQAGGSFAVTANAFRLVALDTPMQRVILWAQITGETGDPYVQVIARAKEDTVGSPFATNNGYAVRLTRQTSGDLLSVHKLDSGVATLLLSLPVTLASPKDVLVPIGIVVEDIAGFVTVFAFLDDLATERFSVIDRQPPLWRTGGLVGFETFEGTAQINPQTRVERFAATILDQEDSDAIQNEAPIQWNFLKIVQHAQERTDQGGKGSVSLQQMKDFVNFSEQQFVTEVGDVDWRVRSFRVTSRANNRFMTLPRRISEEIISIQDLTNSRPLDEIPMKDLGIRTTNRDLDSGTPILWARAGHGSGDRIRLELFPKPTGEFVYEIFAKAMPGLMVEDEDYPLVPQRYAEAIVIGAVQRAAMQSGNDKLLSWNQSHYNRIRNGAISANRRGKESHIRSGRSTPARRLRPPTRRDQLGGRFF